jgi:peptidoglycan/xylan/chitin deacetylase (PgdA/CDA1 family)
MRPPRQVEFALVHPVEKMKNSSFNPLIPILMYHQVTPHPLPAFRKYAVTPKAFAAQMNWLARVGYVPVNLDVLLDYRNDRGTLPSRPVIITFDDGFQDCVEHAVPVLQAHGFTAIFYLVVGLMGKTSQWLLAERGIELPLMDWTAAQQLIAAGFQCGSHCMTHLRLADLSSAACREELLRSRLLLEDKLAHEVKHLAYPFGSFNERVRAIVAETGYRSACSVRIGLSTEGDDPLALHRVPVSGQDSLLDFIYRLRTARSFGEFMRGQVRALLHWHSSGAQAMR